MRTHNHIPEFVVAHLHGEATEEQPKAAAEWMKTAENMVEFHLQLEKLNSLSADLQRYSEFVHGMKVFVGHACRPG